MKLDGRALYEAWAWEVRPDYPALRWEEVPESHRRAWEALAKAVDRSPPIARHMLKVAFDPINYGVIVVGAELDTAGHHRSCAIRRGGNECTC